MSTITSDRTRPTTKPPRTDWRRIATGGAECKAKALVRLPKAMLTEINRTATRLGCSANTVWILLSKKTKDL